MRVCISASGNWMAWFRHSGRPHTIGAVAHPIVAHSRGGGARPRGVGAVLRLGEAEGDAHLAGEHLLAPVLLRWRARVVRPEPRREVADDRRLVLQVVVESEALGRKV